MQEDDFDLRDFLPYALNQAAEVTSQDFQTYYKRTYGMLRTEWRVLFHLGRYGDLTAKEICDRASLHKTKVSRAVHALEDKRYLRRTPQEADRRHETLSLTRQGEQVFRDLFQAARRYNDTLLARFTPQEQEVLRKCLARITEG